MDKEYGKLTEDQFKRFIRKLPEFRHESKDLQPAQNFSTYGRRSSSSVHALGGCR